MGDLFTGLRCRVGDLAVIVRDEPECHSNIGQIVEVLGKYNGFFKQTEFYWSVKPLSNQPSAVLIGTPGTSGCKVVYDCRPRAHQDAWLRPLRNTGDDVADELCNDLAQQHKQDMRCTEEAGHE